MIDVHNAGLHKRLVKSPKIVLLVDLDNCSTAVDCRTRSGSPSGRQDVKLDIIR